MSNVVDPSAKLAELEAQTQAKQDAKEVADQGVLHAKAVHRKDGEHVRDLNIELTRWRGIEKETNTACFASVYERGMDALDNACGQWLHPRQMVAHIEAQLENMHRPEDGLLDIHKIDQLSAICALTNADLHLRKHQETVCETGLAALAVPAAEAQGSISIGSEALDECRRRTAAAAKAAEDAMLALAAERERQRRVKQESRGFVRWNSPV